MNKKMNTSGCACISATLLLLQCWLLHRRRPTSWRESRKNIDADGPEINPFLTHDSSALVHILWQLICGNDAKSCLNKECRATNGQGDDDDEMGVLSGHMIIDCVFLFFDWCAVQFKCILRWVGSVLPSGQFNPRSSCWLLIRLARAWNFKWGANNVAVPLCYLSFAVSRCSFVSDGRRSELTKSIPAASQHLCEYRRVIMYHLHNLRTRSLILLHPTPSLSSPLNEWREKTRKLTSNRTLRKWRINIGDVTRLFCCTARNNSRILAKRVVLGQSTDSERDWQ